MVMSDWGAVHNHVDSINAGLNLEMPATYNDSDVINAVTMGEVTNKQLDRMAQGVLKVIERAERAMNRNDATVDVDIQDEVAYRAAANSIVMLKNENNILPLKQKSSFGIIGEFARTPRYQGGGSSHITPTRMTSFLDALDDRGIQADFAPGFTLNREEQDENLTSAAVNLAQKTDTVLFFMGLPRVYESEGYDRQALDVPSKQIDVLKAVWEVNKNIIVILSNGSVVSVAPWQHMAKDILESWLLGQAGGSAIADTIFGSNNPYVH